MKRHTLTFILTPNLPLGVTAQAKNNGTLARNLTDFVVAAVEHVKKTTDVTRKVVFILPLLLAGAACVTPPTPAMDASTLFRESFDQRQTLPATFTPVNGMATVVTAEGGRHLKLPATPKLEHGVLFGPAMAEGVRVGARFRATAGEQAKATFAVGLSGLSGYRLRVNPDRQQLELCRDTAVAQKVPFQSVPGQWTHLRLQLRPLPGLKWAVQGKAWDESQQEPEASTLEWTDTAKPELGQAAVWGTQLGGEPVAVDDIRLWLIEP